MSGLAKQKCKPCEGGMPPYTDPQAKEMLKRLKGWILEDTPKGPRLKRI